MNTVRGLALSPLLCSHGRLNPVVGKSVEWKLIGRIKDKTGVEVRKRLFHFVQCLMCQSVNHKRMSADTFVHK
jgi:hypothetical protein